MILIVDCYLDPAGGTHNFAPFLKGVVWESVRPTREPLPEPALWKAVIITGSGANMADGYEGQGMRAGWTRELVDWIVPVVRSGVPVLGVCFGHQVLGAAFGGGVSKARPPEVGFVEIQRSDDPLLDALPERFHCFVSHEDQVSSASPDIEVIATSKLCSVQALRIRDEQAWGIQFHAEMSLKEARQLLEYRAGKHPELGLDVQAELERSERMAGVGERVFGRFLEIVSGQGCSPFWGEGRL